MKIRLLICVLSIAALAAAQSPSTTTVQGTVYNAAGAPISGTLQLSWPAFTTAASQAIAAGRLTVNIGAKGLLSVNLAPNMGATPAGLYYTAVYHLADGTTSTEYWIIPAAPQATLAAVRAQVMPAAQAVQAVNKAYVDQAIQQAESSQISSFGGTLTGPLYLNGDPLIPTQAADKHYVDAQFAQSLPVAGGTATGSLTATQLGAVYQADQAPGADFTSKLQACINQLDGAYGGTCDARNFTGSLTLAAPINISTANVTVQLPCATIATAFPIVIAPGTRNVTLHGCATRGTSSASGSQGGTVFLFSGSAALFQIGDSAYAADTVGFHLDNVAVNTTAASAATAQAIAAWRTQEMQLSSLYLLGNSNQTALTLDGTGNYTGGTFSDIEIGGFQTAVNAIGHQVANSATTDWLNASTFLRLHIDCPTIGGNPIGGTTGINLQQGDGNTITGGDVEGCGTALHLGANAQSNTIVGLRNENSTYQVVADAGSSYNNWITGGTIFTGKLTDNGTRNSFLDTFHRSFNALNGDWYGSQQDATLTNHFRLGIGSGNERGLLNRYQTDYGYRWTTGLSDASAGEQFYQVLDELNNVNRLSIGQYNSGQFSTNNQTVLNSAGSGAIVLNGSNNAGTGGVVIGSGGATSSTVATIDKSGNANFTGSLQVGGAAQSSGTYTVRNNADAEVDYYLWPGLTASQKGSFTYKDYNGNSQWYLVKDASNNWAVSSAVSGLDSFKAYQSTNSGDTYVNASNSSGAVRVNYESGSGSAFNIYGGNSGSLYASFAGSSSIKFPGLAASAGHNCVQIDNSGWITNSGQPCGSGTVSSGSSGQIAYYSANGTAVSGMAAVPLTAGGTGASDAPTALANLGAVPASGGALTGPLTGTAATFSTSLAAGTTITLAAGQSITSALTALPAGGKLILSCGTYTGGFTISKPSIEIDGAGSCTNINSQVGADTIDVTANGAVLQNFAVTASTCTLPETNNCNYKGVKLNNVTGFTANNLQISGVPADGLAAYNSSQISINGGNFSGNGLTVAGSSGVLLHNVTQATADKVTASNNGPTLALAGVGIKAEADSGATTSSITVSNSTTNGNGYYGLAAVGSGTKDVTFANDHAWNNGEIDIDAHAPSRITVSDCNVGASVTGTKGVSLDTVQGFTIHHCQFTGHSGMELEVTASSGTSSNGVVDDNLLTSSLGQPIQIINVSGSLKIASNIITAPSGTVGIITFNNGAQTITGNQVTETTNVSGIYIGESNNTTNNSGATVSNNSVILPSGSTQPAISAWGGTGLTVFGNTGSNWSKEIALNSGATLANTNFSSPISMGSIAGTSSSTAPVCPNGGTLTTAGCVVPFTAVQGTPSTSPLCPNGTNGSLTTTGCVFTTTNAVQIEDVTNLTANASYSYAVPAGNAGWYRVNCYPILTTAATTSSTLPYCVVQWTDADAGTANGIQLTASSTANNVGRTGIVVSAGYTGALDLHAAAGTNITIYTTGYASSGTTSMAYALHQMWNYLHP